MAVCFDRACGTRVQRETRDSEGHARIRVEAGRAGRKQPIQVMVEERRSGLDMVAKACCAQMKGMMSPERQRGPEEVIGETQVWRGLRFGVFVCDHLFGSMTAGGTAGSVWSDG